MLAAKPARVAEFSIGRRWRVDPAPDRYRGIGIEFVIIGKGEAWFDSTVIDPAGKKCMIVADAHNHDRFCACGHGTVDTYKHKHLKKRARLLPHDAPPQDALPPPGVAYSSPTHSIPDSHR